MIEFYACEAPVSSGTKLVEEHKGCCGSVRLLDWKASQEEQTLEEFVSLNISGEYILALEQAFFTMGQQPIHLLRTQLHDWYCYQAYL